MSNISQKTKNMVLCAMFIALIIVMALIPGIGYIPLGFMNATIIHIPVIIGAVLLGPKTGALLGLTFGISSMIVNTISPNISSFVFSPFYSGGNFYSVFVCLIPRILIGITSYYVYTALKKTGKEIPALAAAGFVGSMTNTLLVMGGIYLFFGSAYAQAKGLAYEALMGIIMGIVATQGIPEALVAAVLTAALCKVLVKVCK